MITSTEISSSHPIEIVIQILPQLYIYIDLIEELYRHTNFYMSGEEPSNKSFQTSSGEAARVNHFNLFVEYTMCIF